MSFLASKAAQRSPVSAQSHIGVIRAGTKVPTRGMLNAAANNPSLQKFLEAIKSGEMSFQDAEKAIKKESGIANPFFPRNPPYFLAHPWDMEGGAAVSKAILDLYGEQRDGDTVPRLYRFPVIFLGLDWGNIDEAVNGRMAVQGGDSNTIRYHSRYGADGKNYCCYLPAIERSEQSARKQFVRRSPVIRGECNPSECPQFASGACRFEGSLRFYIPGIPGAGTFLLKTGSEDAMTEVFVRLDALKRAIGRIPSFTPDGKPVFWLTKKQVRRTYFDAQGNRKEAQQWVVSLDCLIEVPKIIRIIEERNRQLADPSATPAVAGVPAAWTSPQSTSSDDPFGEPEEVAGDGIYVDDSMSHSPESLEGTGCRLTASDSASFDPKTVSVTDAVAAESSEPKPVQQESGAAKMLRLAQEGGYLSLAKEWAELRFGRGWEGSAETGEIFSRIVSRYGVQTPHFLKLAILLTHENVAFDKVALPYINAKFGGLFAGNLAEVYRNIHALFEESREEAIAHMTSQIPCPA